MARWRHSGNNKEGPPSKRQIFSREDSRDKETRTLLSKLVAKELGEMNKAEEKEEVKGKELKAHVVSILEEVKKIPTRLLPCLLIQLLVQLLVTP